MKIGVLFPSLALICVLTPLAAFAQGADSQPVSQAPQPVAPVVEQQAVARPAATSVEQIEARIAEARRMLKTRSPLSSTDEVALAALDTRTSQIQLLTVSKQDFLERGADVFVPSSSGRLARVRIDRANGVNTAVTVFDTSSNRQLLPLVVQYPIVKGGRLTEMAYYTSAHPALLSAPLVDDGKSYVRTMLDEAADRLRAQGVEISPEIVDIAEHLCVVEHTDHKRFMTEDRASLFQEILALYALNKPDTFRYSVSTAGAGGMIQMIPQTYQAIRANHPNVALEADFVSGMRNHANALTAMLLYMQDTWDTLARSPEVRDALSSGTATQAELVAAGYNSNPLRLPLYLRRAGSEWRSAIPAETQMYLAIYGSLDSTVKLAGAGASHQARTVRRSNSSTAASSALQGFSIANIAKILPDFAESLVVGPLLLGGMR